MGRRFGAWRSREERGARNLLIRSNDLTHVAWGRTGLGSIVAETAPDGSSESFLLTCSNGSSSHRIDMLPSNLANGEEAVASIIVKSGSLGFAAIAPNGAASGTNFNAATGAGTGNVNTAPLGSGFVPWSNGYVRIWVRFAFLTGQFVRFYATQASGGTVTFTSVNTETIHFWRPQVDRGPKLGPYRATGAAVIL